MMVGRVLAKRAAGDTHLLADERERRPDDAPHVPSWPAPLAGLAPNLLERGKPFGARRPASARLPRQSASSFRVSVKVRSAASTHESPSAPLNVLTSERPPSL